MQAETLLMVRNRSCGSSKTEEVETKGTAATKPMSALARKEVLIDCSFCLYHMPCVKLTVH